MSKEEFNEIVEDLDSTEAIRDFAGKHGVETGSFTKREFALLVWQSVSNFMENRGFELDDQMTVVNQCIKDLIGMEPPDIQRLAAESYDYSYKVDEWLNSHKKLWDP